jgi:two-component system OmpR family response regulator
MNPSDPRSPPPGRAEARGRVLVVDDERNITDLLATALRFVGFEVAVAGSGRDALDRAATFVPDLVVLDVMMPDYDGFEVCRRLRADGVKAPVIFLTARDATEDKVAGLRMGADDYVTKPFSLEELIARVEAILRRSAGGTGPDGETDERLELADLVMDVPRHEVRRAGELVALSPTEFRLLRFLLANAGRVLSKAQILDHVWDYDFDGDGNVVETYISYLRRKLDRPSAGERGARPSGAEGAAPDRPPLIHTVRGVGYTLRLPPGSPGSPGPGGP